MSDKKPKNKFDREAFKAAIAQVESSGGRYLDNPNSSAAGRYHFLYRYIKDVPELQGVSKREFINRPELQEKIMDMAIDGKLPGFPSYRDNAFKLKAKYNTNLRPDEIAALTHFLGAAGVEKYLSNPGEFSVPGNNNATVQQYVQRFNEAGGTTPSFVSDPRKNYKQLSEMAPPSIDQSIQGMPQMIAGQMVEVAPTEEIYSSINESFDDEVYTRSLIDNPITETPVETDPANDALEASQAVDNPGVRLSNYIEGKQNNEFAKGGLMSKCGGPGQPPCPDETLKDVSPYSNIGDTQFIDQDDVDESRSRIEDYLNSDGFLRIMGKSDPNPEKVRDSRLSNVQNADVEIVNSIHKNGPGTISGLVDDNGDIKLEGHLFKGIPEHEFNHASTFGNRDLNQFTIDNINARITDPVEGRNYLNDPTEAHARIINSRLLLQHAGLWDYNEREFNEDDLKRLKKDLKDNPDKYRVQDFYDLIQSVNTDDDFIWLMNNIAANNNNSNVNVASYGGKINSSNSNDLVEFNSGGTHEENPLGGIPQGIGANGKLNTVEEGESKFSFDDGDYVFSNRIML